MNKEENLRQGSIILTEWQALLRSIVSEGNNTHNYDDRVELVPVVTPIALEVSNSLTPFVDAATESGSRFLDEMFPLMEEGLFYEIGVQFPGVRVRSLCSYLPDDQYTIKINEVPVASGQMSPDSILVNESAERLAIMNIEGEPTINPVNGRDACWIPADKKDMVEGRGYTTWDVPAYMILHLASILRRYAYEFVGIQEVQSSLDKLYPAFPALIQEVCPKVLSLQQLTDILRRLVEEEISICNLKGILEALAEWGQVEKDPVKLTEYVRMTMKRYITYKYSRGGNTLEVYLLDPQIEQAIKDSIQHTKTGNYLELEPEISQDIFDAVRSGIGDFTATAQQPVIVTNVEIRRYFRQLVKLEFPYLVVLSFQELDPEMNIHPLARISVLDVEQEGSPDQGEEETMDADDFEKESGHHEICEEESNQTLGDCQPESEVHFPSDSTEKLEGDPQEEMEGEPDLAVESNQEDFKELLTGLEKATEEVSLVAFHPSEEGEWLQSSEESLEGQESSLEWAASPYDSQLDYFADRLLHLQMSMIRCSHLKRNRRSEYSGLLLDPVFVEHVLGGVDSSGVSLSSSNWDELERQRLRLEEGMRLRVEATHREGFDLPLERMIEEFGLSPLDELILLLALAFSFDPQFEKFCTFVGSSTVFSLPTVQLACAVLTESVEQERNALHHFSSQAPLFKYSFLKIQGQRYGLSAAPLEQHEFFLESDMLWTLTDKSKDRTAADDKGSGLPPEILQICKRQMEKTKQQLARRGLWLEYEADLIHFFVERADGTKGVRDLQRLIEQHINQPMTELLLKQADIQHIRVSICEESINLTVVHGEEKKS